MEKTVMLVEDDAIIAMASAQSLEKLGYKVITVNSGEDAIKVFRSHNDIDLVLMDIDLGRGMDGTEAARIILKERDVPVVFLSGHVEPEVVKKTEKITSYGYVTKNSGITVLDASMKMAFKLFEAKQREAEEKENLKTTFTSIGDAVITTDENGMITRMNPVAESLTNWTAAEAKGRPLGEVFNIINGITRRPVVDPVTKVLKGGQIVGLANHTVLISRDGREYQIADSGAPIRMADGTIKGVVLVFRDVTEDYRLQEDLRLNKERLDLAMNVANSGFWDWDLKTNSFYFDPRFYTMAGCDVDEFPHKMEELIKRVHPDDVEYVMSVLENIRNGKIDNYEIEYRFQHMNGSWMWMLSKGKIVEWKDKKPSRLLGFHIDITKRKQTEIEMKRNRDYIQKLLDIAGVLFVVLDRDGKVTLINKKGSEVLGYHQHEILGKNWLENFLPENIVDETRSVFQRLMAGEQEASEFYENPILTADGEERIIAWHNTILTDEGGKITGTLSCGDDITERKKMEEELEKALQEKKRLLQELQHRAKNNFAMISSMASLMTNNIESAEARGALMDMQSRILAVSEMYDLLSSTVSMVVVQLDEYLEKVVHSVPGIPPNIEFKTSMDSMAMPVKSAIPVGLITTELLTNSIKHAFPNDRKGSISIVLKKTAKGGLIEVKDDGVGLPRDFDASTVDSLGMKLVNALAQQIDGEFKIDQQDGTRCIVEFPLEQTK